MKNFYAKSFTIIPIIFCLSSHVSGVERTRVDGKNILHINKQSSLIRLRYYLDNLSSAKLTDDFAENNNEDFKKKLAEFTAKIDKDQFSKKGDTEKEAILTKTLIKTLQALGDNTLHDCGNILESIRGSIKSNENIQIEKQIFKSDAKSQFASCIIKRENRILCACCTREEKKSLDLSAPKGATTAFAKTLTDPIYSALKNLTDQHGKIVTMLFNNENPIKEAFRLVIDFLTNETLTGTIINRGKTMNLLKKIMTGFIPLIVETVKSSKELEESKQCAEELRVMEKIMTAPLIVTNTHGTKNMQKPEETEETKEIKETQGTKNMQKPQFLLKKEI